MAFIETPNCVQVVMSADRSGEERKNIFHYEWSGTPPSIAELDALADEIAASILPAQGVITCLGTNWNSIRVEDMSSAGALVRTKAVNFNGSAFGGVLPGNSSHCLTKRTSFRGPRYRGRYYLFDLPEGYFNGDDVEFSFLPFITNLANELIKVRVGGKFTPSVRSKVAPSCVTNFNAVTFDLVADSQRRRLKKRGR